MVFLSNKELKNILLLLSALFLQCEQRKTEAPTLHFDLVAIQNHIHQANANYGYRFLTDSLPWYEERYCQNACAMPEDTTSICGIDQLIAYYYNQGKNKDFIIEVEAKAIYGSDSAVVEEGIYQFPNPNGGFYDQGKFIAIWKQENGLWKIHREIWNSNQLPTDQK